MNKLDKYVENIEIKQLMLNRLPNFESGDLINMYLRIQSELATRYSPPGKSLGHWCECNPINHD